ncbi:serine/threonine dehydratase [Nocardia terpenica]|uniref:serine/threonine dehydratase n=1 Tax=Nocardia terpenica TaxID=455432 RepID=UPI001892F0FA|nr:serine/threonine dehydratase [Nocardia terpenica]MBF6063603.1 serine/threonine dehydratase [Nocardia terpenica]MBF6109388.1 serine/threonine dehydratase [Nocardia terpenica]MBF6114152.1 serine/threonine dehydratase [Nocardia terpenica]MBF6123822.1 serine/threonine dehydratase [Nocardia terpenica]MBF6157133.1 serine/threonine dehydratase [Nocardia terpenica]
MVDRLGYDEIKTAADRIAGLVRPIAVSPVEAGAIAGADSGRVWLAHEYLQHTGTFKARGALNFIAAHKETGTLPDAGVTIASGGNAALACAWAARREGVRATVFVPENAPRVKVDRLRRLGAEVRQVGTQYAEAAAACVEFAERTGALASHAYDNPLIAAGAGTLLDEIRDRLPDLDTVVVAVGGGGLFAGVATAAGQHGMRTVAVEPRTCRALNAAVEAGHPVDVPVDSIAADSLGARRVTPLALTAATVFDTRSVLVDDADIVAARQTLWDDRRIAVEAGGATALAALLRNPQAYIPAPGEHICIVLCGANTDPSDLANG